MTGKRIEIEGSKFTVHTDNGILPVEALSSGEKQILLILLRVFLLNGNEAIVMIDGAYVLTLILNGKFQAGHYAHSSQQQGSVFYSIPLFLLSLAKDGEIRFGIWIK